MFVKDVVILASALLLLLVLLDQGELFFPIRAFSFHLYQSAPFEFKSLFN
jgi:hypothetical protein